MRNTSIKGLRIKDIKKNNEKQKKNIQYIGMLNIC